MTYSLTCCRLQTHIPANLLPFFIPGCESELRRVASAPAQCGACTDWRAPRCRPVQCAAPAHGSRACAAGSTHTFPSTPPHCCRTALQPQPMPADGQLQMYPEIFNLLCRYSRQQTLPHYCSRCLPGQCYVISRPPNTERTLPYIRLARQVGIGSTTPLIITSLCGDTST